MKMSKEELNNKLDALWQLDHEERELAERELYKEFYQGWEVGDGVTYHLWSDSHACTIIKRTPKTIVIQEDIATLDPNFKPEWIVGGFAGHCVNQDDQSYTYKRNPNGCTIKIRWSDKHNGWMYLNKKLSSGRHEFYDYNF